MGENNDKTMEQLKNLLENENVSNAIKSIMNMMDKKDDSKEKNQNMNNSTTELNRAPVVSNEKENYPNNLNPERNMADNMDLMIKIKKIYEKINDHDDPRTNLLLALKPYLNSQRKTHIDNAIKIVNITRLSGVINELD
jgi:hypothetical protein